jgi:hypothetical protein
VPLLVIAVPSTVAPYLNVTVSPSGMMPLVEDTVAVKVTADPRIDGFGDDVNTVVVVYLLTVCLTVPELVMKVASPTYTAAIVNEPAASDDVLNIACPAIVVAVPSTAAPFLNVTVSPSGIRPPAEDRVAVKVTDDPRVDGFSDDVSTVVDVYFATVCFTVPELVANVASPAYSATMENEPAASDEELTLACPALVVDEPTTVAPFLNVTVSPSGMAPCVEDTVAVNVTT